jgi:MerR family transcriptional regulator, light-induced transcriptional regulator
VDGRIKAFLTPKDLAEALGVSESSLKRWADDGVIRVSRTAGGHRRIALADAVRFARESGLQIEHPAALGLEEILPARRGADAPATGTADAIYAAFLRDDWRVARGLIVNAYVTGESVATLCDGAIREALSRAGELWEHGSDGIVVEHRAVDTCLQALSLIRSLIPAGAATAPVALGAAFANDPYVLPSLIAAVVLADAGFRDVNLGPTMPTAALTSAVERYAPALVWRTVSITADAEAVRRDLSAVLEKMPPHGSMVLGGRGVPPGIHHLPERIHHLGSMSELAGFARGILAMRASDAPPPAADPVAS